MKIKIILISLLILNTLLNAFNQNDVVTVGNETKETSIMKINNKLKVFGTNLFNGNFKKNKIVNYNPNYLININDKINIKIWGAINTEFILTVDNKWNIFIPEIGVVNLKNVKSSELQKILNIKLKEIYTNNVSLYVNVLNIQPINILVSGNVVSPGMYEGFSTDSIINFIDKANGINPKIGSFRNISLIRNNKIIHNFDLYDFLLKGKLNNILLKNGDTLFINFIKKSITVNGDVYKPFIFELKDEKLDEVLKNMAILKNNATNFVIEKENNKYNQGKKQYKINEAKTTKIENGDYIFVQSNHFTENIKIYIKGEHNDLKEKYIKKGTNLEDFIKKINLNKQSNIKNVQIFRESVAIKQKQLIDAHLKELEILVTTQEANTVNEGLIIAKERSSILGFIEKAKQVKPKGQIIISKGSLYKDIILEDNDIIKIPNKNNLIIIEGEVSFPGAHTYVENLTVKDYIDKTGGFTNKANKDRVLLVQQNGEVIQLSDGWFFSDLSHDIDKTDSILVLPEVKMKAFQIGKDVTEMLYQIALSAGVIMAL